LPADPSNQYADNPDAATFGQKLFFDTRFSANGKVARHVICPINSFRMEHHLQVALAQPPAAR
jgi:cytochrome c peroxidase